MKAASPACQDSVYCCMRFFSRTKAVLTKTTKVVLLDDSLVVRYILRNLLHILCLNSHIDLQIYTSEDGVQGLGYIFIERPDIIIVDTTLPKYSGREVVEFLATNNQIKESRKKLVILTQGDEIPQFTPNQIVVSKKDPLFLVKLLHHMASLIGQPKAEIAPTLIDRLRVWLGQNSLKHILRSDHGYDQIRKINKLAAPYYLFSWLMHQALLSLNLTLFRLITRNFHEANLAQVDKDTAVFRARYYPTLAVLLTSIILLILQLFAYVTSGLLLFQLAERVDKAEAAYANGYYYKRTVTLDYTKVSGGANLTNFPIVVNGTYSYLATIANGGKVTNSSGFDIIFTSDSAGSTKLDHEIEKYNATTGEITMWVEIPTLSYTTNTTIYMFYGNSSISTSQENKTGVWDTNFRMVHHLEEGTTGATDFKDSTSNNNHSNAVTIDGTGSNANASGKIGPAVQFDGSNDNIRVADAASLDITSNFTVSLWYNADTLPGSSKLRNIVAKTGNVSLETAGTQTNYALGLNQGLSGSGHWSSVAFENSSHADSFTSQSFTSSTSTWYHYVGVFNDTANTITMYRNGSQVAQTTSVTAVPAANAKPLYIGVDNAAELAAISEYWDGYIDEVRVSNSARTAGWITTEYNNQNSPSTFYTLGSEETNPAVTVGTYGTQNATLFIPYANQQLGGMFAISSTASLNITGITISEQGTIDAAGSLDNIKLRYEFDTTAPRTCDGATYSGSETQFGSTDADGFSSSNGTSSFTGTAAVSATQTMCVFVIFDVNSNAAGGETIEIQITNPSTDVTVSTDLVGPSTAVAISGTTTLIIYSDITVSAYGTQSATINGPATNQYIGGALVLKDGQSSYHEVVSITIREQGTVDAQNYLDNIKLYYDLDISGPIDCASESYSGSESQFGSTDTDGFDGTNGSSTFTGLVEVNEGQTMCVYVVLDILDGAENTQTIEIDIANPSTDVVAAIGGTVVTPSTAVVIPGTSTLSVPIEVTVSVNGSQNSSITAPSTNSYIGGSFVMTSDGGTATITGVTIAEQGTVDAQSHLKNIKLFYELDSSAPFNCASETYAGSETQFGSTDANGFDSANGISAFTGSVNITTAQAFCAYVVLDITIQSNNGDTLEIQISDPSTQVTLTLGTTTPATAVAIGGTTTVSNTATTINLQVNANADSAYDTAGSGSLNYINPLRLGGKSTTNVNTTGVRFNGVTVPNGALINAVTLDFQENWGSDYGTNVKNKFYAEATDNAATYSTGSLPRDRTKTTASVDWDTNGVIVASGSWYSTSTTAPIPELKTIVQEVVDRSGWASGNSLSIIATDDGSTNDWWAEPRSHDFGASSAPKISITYTTTTVTVSSTGSQNTPINGSTTNQYIGGAFVITPTNAQAFVTGITITEQGSVDASTGLDNIKLFYELDGSAPYDCASESYAGTETQFGSTDSDGFSAANGTSAFTGRIQVATTQAMCVYTVLDVTAAAANAETIEIQISSPNSGGVTLSSGSVSTSGNITITGTTTLYVDTPPIVSSVSLNGGSNINLTENTTTSISATATITDANGHADISSATSKIYRSGVVSAQDCTTNNNNCYSASCSLTGCSGNSCTATCTINIQFHADPTEAGTTYASEYWLAWIQATDGSANTASSYSPNNVTEVNKLVALNVTSSVSYGSLQAGNNTGASNEVTTITNTGNSAIDLEISGSNLCTDHPTCSGATIGVGQQQYKDTTFTYGAGTALGTSPATLNMSLAKPTDSPSNSTGSVYWGIALPSQISVGSYSGQNNIVAIPDN